MNTYSEIYIFPVFQKCEGHKYFMLKSLFESLNWQIFYKYSIEYCGRFTFTAQRLATRPQNRLK